MNFKAKRINTLGYTTLIQSSQQNHLNIQIPRMIKWKDVTLPEEWTLDEVQPQPPPQRILSDTNFINQTRDGTINISFDRQSRNLPETYTPRTSVSKPIIESVSSESLSRRDLELDKDMQRIKIVELEQ